MEKGSEEVEKNFSETINLIKITLKKIKIFLVISDEKIDKLASKVLVIEKRLSEKLTDKQKITNEVIRLNQRLNVLEEKLGFFK